MDSNEEGKKYLKILQVIDRAGEVSKMSKRRYCGAKVWWWMCTTKGENKSGAKKISKKQKRNRQKEIGTQPKGV